VSAQQGCPLPPQAPQVPFMQTSPPTLQAVPATQQGCPVPPQGLQVFADVHSSVPVHLLPQQGSPASPHPVHRPSAQARSAMLQASLAQQGWLAPPHITQDDPIQAEPLAQMFPQQAWPALPQATQAPAAPHWAPGRQSVPQQAWLAPPHGTH
jgi:hypothetical protein